jgi:hypothetical protein
LYNTRTMYLSLSPWLLLLLLLLPGDVVLALLLLLLLLLGLLLGLLPEELVCMPAAPAGSEAALARRVLVLVGPGDAVGCTSHSSNTRLLR